MCCLIQVSAGILINQTNKTECKNRTAVKTAKSSVSKRLLAMQKKPSCSACTYLYEYRWASSALGLQGECNCDFRNRKEQLDGIFSCALKTSLPNMDKYSWYEQMLPWQFFRKWKFQMQTILWGLSSETSPKYPGNMFPIWLHPPLTSSVMITGCKKLTMNQLFVFSLTMSWHRCPT